MITDKIIKKYDMSPSEVNIVISSILENKRLVEISDQLKSRFSQEQVFVIAKEICKITFDAPIDEISPQLALDRIEMNEANSPAIIRRKMINADMKRLLELNEDLIYLKMELRVKAA
jgi:hypothetical protein